MPKKKKGVSFTDLKSFEYSFPTRNLSLAKDRLLTDSVDIVSTAPGNYEASVRDFDGEKKVKIRVKGYDIVNYSCECTDNPFSRCYHCAAAFYRLKAALDKNEAIETRRSFTDIKNLFGDCFTREALIDATAGDDYADGYKMASSGYVNITSDSESDEVREVSADTAVYLAEPMQSVSVKLSKDGTPVAFSCSCNDQKHGKLCKHAVALLCALFPRETEPDTVSDRELLSLIINSPASEKRAYAGELLSLEPYLDGSPDKLLLGFRVGRDRMYILNSLSDFLASLSSSGNVKLGKSLEFTATPNSFDERSRAYIRFISRNRKYIGVEDAPKDKNKLIRLTPSEIDSLFEIAEGGYISIGADRLLVKRENPLIKINMEPGGKNGFVLFAEQEGYRYIAEGDSSYIAKSDTLLISDSVFKHRAGGLVRVLLRAGAQGLKLAKSDAVSFYSRVIIPAKNYIVFKADNEEALSALPAPLSTRLYIDTDGKKLIASLFFRYDDIRRKGFYTPDLLGAIDPDGEREAEEEVRKWFSVIDLSSGTLYTEESRADFMRVISDGIPALSRKMQITLSDAVEQRSIKRDFDIKYTVDEDGGLLDLSIDTSYSPTELAAILTAYRNGGKYHVFADGSYIDLRDDAFKSFAMISEELAVSDKSIVRKRMKLPFYRILYLNLLSKEGSVAVDCKEGVRRIIDDFENKRESKMKISESVDKIMRDYQKEGFKWLSMINKYGFGGILADDMGLGKTLQTIALIESYRSSTRDEDLLPSLIICPSSLVYNWVQEFEKFAPECPVKIIVGNAASRGAVLSEISSGEVVISSYDALKRDIDLYTDMLFAFIVADDAQYIKNRSTQASKAIKALSGKTRIALTGTPVENRPSDLWSIFDFIMPGYLRNYPRFRESYETPIVKENSQSALARLKMLTSPFILRRMKKDVLSELPEKTETVLCTSFDDEQNKAYTAHAAMLVKDLRDQISLGSGGPGRIEVLSMLMKIRQICCHPPLALGEAYKGESAKLALCTELVRSSVESGHQILLFSQFTSMLDVIAKELESLGISHYMLTGKTPQSERMKLVENFNSGGASVFLVSLKAGGTGLNLTAADIVIHYDPWWNIATQNQATDRAYRIGQTKNVQVYKLIIKDSIEEKIIELQKKKAGIAEFLSGNSENAITSMDAKELISLFENINV